MGADRLRRLEGFRATEACRVHGARDAGQGLSAGTIRRGSVPSPSCDSRKARAAGRLVRRCEQGVGRAHQHRRCRGDSDGGRPQAVTAKSRAAIRGRPEASSPEVSIRRSICTVRARAHRYFCLFGLISPKLMSSSSIPLGGDVAARDRRKSTILVLRSPPVGFSATY